MLRLEAIYGKRFTVLASLILAVLALSGCHRSPEARKAKFLASGKSYMQAKDYPRAILQFRNAVQAAPKDPESSYQLALAYLASPDVRNGIAYLQNTIRLNPKHHDAKLKLDELESMSTNPKVLEQAESDLTSMLGTSPDDADILSTLAITEFRLRKPDEALKHLEAALQKAPENLRVAMTMAKLKLGKRDWAGAEEVLKTAAQKAPKSADSQVALGSFYLSSQKFPESERALRQALQIDPKNGSALWGLATIQVHNGQKDQAEQTYAKLSALPQAQYKPLHAAFLFQEGKRDEAIAELVKLTKKNPDDRALRTGLVTAYMKTNRAPDAEKVLAEALKHNAKDVDALMQRAEIYTVEGKYSEAQSDLDQASHYRPDSGMGHYLRAQVHLAKGERTMEKQELGQALQLEKNNPGRMLPARLELAQALLRDHDGKAALAVLDSKDVPDRQRGMVPVVVLRNYALIDTGNLDQARKNVESALKVVKTADLLIQDAVLKTDRKDYSGARSSLEIVTKANPEDLRALEMLAKTYTDQNQVATATKIVRDQAAGQPKSARLQKFLGDWLFASGDHAGALQAYAAAKKLDPKLTSADIAAARVDIADNKIDAARQVLTGVVQTATNSAVPFLMMGTIEEKSGNIAAAIDNYHKALNLDPQNVMALNNLAFLLADSGQPQQLDEALKLAQQVRAMVPNNGNIDDTMGWVYYKKGIYPSAIQQFEDAVARDTTPSALHQYHLAMAYLMKNDYKRGNEKLSAALKLNPNLPEAKQAMSLLAQAKARNALN
jgi:tetratricopeptide (TPR) repeat protein